MWAGQCYCPVGSSAWVWLAFVCVGVMSLHPGELSCAVNLPAPLCPLDASSTLVPILTTGKITGVTHYMSLEAVKYPE